MKRFLVGLLTVAVGLGAAGRGAEISTSFGIGLSPSSIHAQGPAGRSKGLGGRPNIVFVLTDDLSLDLLRFMPHVQSMMRRGLTFRDYFVSDSLCCPSRASIFTGRFPHNTRVLTNPGPHGGYGIFHARGEERHTFAIVLQRAGYLTAMMGKYLNGYLPRQGQHGGGAAADVPRTYVPPGWNQGDVAGWGYPEFNYALNADGSLQHFGHRASDYMTDVLARRGVRFIDLAAGRHRPFFLELATFAPHLPYTPAPRDAHAFPGLRAPEPPDFDKLPTHAPRWLAVHHALTGGQLGRIDRAFRRRAQSVLAIDRLIGEVEQALRAKGLARSTYLVFSSDNGLHTGEYRLMPGKLTAFDTDIHVPLVVVGPGVRPGTTTDALTENIDLAKTFSAMANARMPGDGHSLLAVVHGRSSRDWRNAILVEHRTPRGSVFDPDLQQPPAGEPTTYEAMRTRRLLYVEYADGELEFYDLRRDPFELHNMADRLGRRQLAQLHRELLALRHCRGRQCWSAMHVPALPGRW